MKDRNAFAVAVVIPSYGVANQILQVLSDVGPEVQSIYVIDDVSPDHCGELVEKNCTDPRVKVLYHAENLGVGAAVMTGYQKAIEDGMDIVVKIDGDGQMCPSLIPFFIAPILAGEADYTKGNRFFNLEEISAMPKIRMLGNAVLSFMTKLSSGYWDLFDPTNGFTAIHTEVVKLIPFHKISQRYFFESDMLFRLNTLRAVVVDIPMSARYGDEVSNLKISKILFEFSLNHVKNFFKRIFYSYYLRDMSIGSIELPMGILLFIFGSIFGFYQWIISDYFGSPRSSGTVMLAALPILLGIQLILSFFANDMANIPRIPLIRYRKVMLSKNLIN